MTDRDNKCGAHVEVGKIRPKSKQTTHIVSQSQAESLQRFVFCATWPLGQFDQSPASAPNRTRECICHVSYPANLISLHIPALPTHPTCTPANNNPSPPILYCLLILLASLGQAAADTPSDISGPSFSAEPLVGTFFFFLWW